MNKLTGCFCKGRNFKSLQIYKKYVHSISEIFSNDFVFREYGVKLGYAFVKVYKANLMHKFVFFVLT